MRDKIIWSTTAERLEQRKIACAALSKIFDIEWHLLETAKQQFLLPKTSDENLSSLILVFELDTSFSLEQYEAIEKAFSPSYKGNRDVVLLGLLASKNLPPDQFLPRFRAYLDGVIIQSTALADELKLYGFAPVKALVLPKTYSAPSQQAFAEGFACFVKDVRVARLSWPIMETVANKLLYLGVEDDWILIDAVAELLTELE